MEKNSLLYVKCKLFLNPKNLSIKIIKIYFRVICEHILSPITVSLLEENASKDFASSVIEFLTIIYRSGADGYDIIHDREG